MCICSRPIQWRDSNIGEFASLVSSLIISQLKRAKAILVGKRGAYSKVYASILAKIVRKAERDLYSLLNPSYRKRNDRYPACK